jgi:hypothetical protein
LSTELRPGRLARPFRDDGWRVGKSDGTSVRGGLDQPASDVKSKVLPVRALETLSLLMALVLL